MKKWIAVLVVVGIGVAGWLYVRSNWRVTLPWNQPKFGQVTRGDIEVPITAPGLTEPHQYIEVKSKASGEVIEVAVVEGKEVKVGDVLARLKKTDEERSRNRAQAELDRANALLAQARLAVEKAKATIQSTEARVAELEQQARITKAEWDRVERLRGSEIALTHQEVINADARHQIVLAQQRAAEANVATAKNGLEEAKEAVKLQQAAVAMVTVTLEDAEERLSETTILSKYDAIVTDVAVTVSEVIQGGQTTFTGGTVIARLADMSQIKVVARVDEADYGRVHAIAPWDALPDLPGHREAMEQDAELLATRSGKVKITVDAFPDEVFEGFIERVEPQGRLNQGSSVIQFNVHVIITGENRHMLPLGLQAQVEFTVESAKDVLRVPSDAVKNYEGERGVWAETQPAPGSDDEFGKKFIPYRLGITDGQFTELIAPKGSAKPLKVGQRVYTKLPKKLNDDE